MTTDILLDTHTWIWFLLKERNTLKPKTVRRIEDAIKNNNCFLSSISILELTRLVALQRIELNIDIHTWVEQATKKSGITVIAIDADIAIDSVLLPNTCHKDPADRIIIATTKKYKCTLLTRDNKILQFAKTSNTFHTMAV